MPNCEPYAQLNVPVMKGRKSYSLKKNLRPFITGTSKLWNSLKIYNVQLPTS